MRIHGASTRDWAGTLHGGLESLEAMVVSGGSGGGGGGCDADGGEGRLVIGMQGGVVCSGLRCFCQ